MKCTKCESNEFISIFTGHLCIKCDNFIEDSEMNDNFLKSIIERYTNPSETNKPGSDGLVDEEGNIL